MLGSLLSFLITVCLLWFVHTLPGFMHVLGGAIILFIIGIIMSLVCPRILNS